MLGSISALRMLSKERTCAKQDSFRIPRDTGWTMHGVAVFRVSMGGTFLGLVPIGKSKTCKVIELSPL